MKRFFPVLAAVSLFAQSGAYGFPEDPHSTKTVSSPLTSSSAASSLPSSSISEGIEFPNSSKSDYLGFCVGSGMKCFEVDKQTVLKHPESLLNKMIETSLGTSGDLVIDIGGKKYFRVQGVYSETFEDILIWMRTGIVTQKLKKDAEVGSQDAQYLFLPDLYEKLSGKSLVHDCPRGYVKVPGNPEYATPKLGKDFCVMKYAASEKGEKAVSTVTEPWTGIDREKAKRACKKNGKRYHLITNDEWMVIARNIEATLENWKKGTAGSQLARGNSKTKGALAPGEDDQPHTGLPDSQKKKGWSYRRTHVLSNKETIWDMAGNVWQWVATDLATTREFGQYDSIEFDFNSFKGVSSNGEDNRTNFGPAGDYNSFQKVGKIYMGDSGAVLRGGSYEDKDVSGIFAAHLRRDKSYSAKNVGFRCAYELP